MIRETSKWWIEYVWMGKKRGKTFKTIWWNPSKNGDGNGKINSKLVGFQQDVNQYGTTSMNFVVTNPCNLMSLNTSNIPMAIWVGLPTMSRIPVQDNTHSPILWSAICVSIPSGRCSTLAGEGIQPRNNGGFTGEEILLYHHCSTGLIVEPTRNKCYIIGSWNIVHYRNGGAGLTQSLSRQGEHVSIVVSSYRTYSQSTMLLTWLRNKMGLGVEMAPTFDIPGIYVIIHMWMYTYIYIYTIKWVCIYKLKI